jgi:hypothetical protein
VKIELGFESFKELSAKLKQLSAEIDQSLEIKLEAGELTVAPKQVEQVTSSENVTKETAPVKSELTHEVVLGMLSNFKQKHGHEKTKKLLKESFGYAKVTEIKESDFEKVRQLCAE